MVPGECVIVIGMSTKDFEETLLEDAKFKFYLAIPTAKPHRATRLYNDRKEVFARVEKHQWIVPVSWLERTDANPIKFVRSDDSASYSRFIGLKNSTFIGLLGNVGVDILLENGTYTITSEFQALIRKRNPYRFS